MLPVSSGRRHAYRKFNLTTNFPNNSNGRKSKAVFIRVICEIRGSPYLFQSSLCLILWTDLMTVSGPIGYEAPSDMDL